MENKLGQEPAFPQSERINKYGEHIHAFAGDVGMSKRLYVATMAMQGLLSSPHTSIEASIEQIIRESYMLADELLKQEGNA